MSITTKSIRIVYVLLIVICFFAGIICVKWNNASQVMSSIGIELLAAAVLAGIFITYDWLKETAGAQDQDNLKNALIAAISHENKVNQQYKFFLCTPITSCIDFDASDKITSASYKVHKNIHCFSADLQKKLRESGNGQVYYGLNINDDVFNNEGFPRDLTRTQFDLYLQKMQTRHVDALHSTEFFVSFLPFEKGVTNSIFEAGVAAGRKVKSLYFYKTENSLPPIMRSGDLYGNIKSVMKPNLDAQIRGYMAASPADKTALIETLAYEINIYYQGKDVVG